MGLTFIPTPKEPTPFEVLRDFNNFSRKLRSMTKPVPARTNQDGFNLFKTHQSKSTETISYTNHAHFEGSLDNIKLELTKSIHTTNQSNLSRRQRQALKNLSENNNIIINKADKGSTIVIQNKTDYINEAMQHLNDKHTYLPLPGDPTYSICKQIRNKLMDYYKKLYITKNMLNFCLPPNKARLARIYFLKKIHKNPMGIRPIVSSCNSPTENISQFIDYWLQPHTKLLPSYLKDTTQFVQEIESFDIPNNSILVTVDVKSLYTNIPHYEGILACKRAFITLETLNQQQPPAEILTALLEIVLKNNTFEFNNLYFKQIHGTAMGTKLAPAYANTFMGDLENNFLKTQHFKPIYYRRFIDDIFMIWPHPIEELKHFIDRMNNIHHSIKFTYEHSSSTVTFLDTDVHIDDNNKLSVTTHIKSTNKQAYTHAKSYHPPGTSKGIAIGEAKRYAKTNTHENEYKKMVMRHILQMKVRGYTSKQLLTHILSVKHSDRFNKNKSSVNHNRPIFITRYSKSAAKFIQIIRRNWHHIQHDPAVGRYFPNYPIMAFTRNKNLKNYLVRAKIKQDNPQDTETETQIPLALEHSTICDDPKISPMFIPHDYINYCAIRGCFLHKYLNTSLRIQSHITKRSFRVRGKLDCNSKNIIYLIQCKRCNKQYIGQTSTCLRHRIAQHINNKASPNSTVDQHFCQSGHTLTVQPIEQISTDSNNTPTDIKNKLYKRENYWINKLKTVYPQGLNWTSGKST